MLSSIVSVITSRGFCTFCIFFLICCCITHQFDFERPIQSAERQFQSNQLIFHANFMISYKYKYAKEAKNMKYFSFGKSIKKIIIYRLEACHFIWWVWKWISTFYVHNFIWIEFHLNRKKIDLYANVPVCILAHFCFCFSLYVEYSLMDFSNDWIGFNFPFKHISRSAHWKLPFVTKTEVN